jgi:hypothetical protein
MPVVLALRLQTRSIPIVFVGPSDPSKLEPSRLDRRATSPGSSAKENRSEVLRLAAGYVDRVRTGEKPGRSAGHRIARARTAALR